jgi:hypothetical protein
MTRVIKKTVRTTITQTEDGTVEETFTKVEVTEDAETSPLIEKHTFFLDDETEEEEWFKKSKEDEEDDSVDIYMLDDDKSW